MRSALIILSSLALAGCGGHVGSQARSVGKGRGRATFSVKWPAETRLIPNTSRTLLITASKNGQPVGTVLITRPTSSGTLTGLPYGTIDVKIEAKPNNVGTGVSQAVGVGSMTVSEDVPGTLSVALDSTATTLDLTKSASYLRPGQSCDLMASAKDLDGNIVLLTVGTAQETIAWSSSDTSVATVTGTGPMANLKGLSAGTSTLTASLKVKDDNTTISGALNLSVSAVAGEDYRLAVGGYPKTGGDVGNSGRGGAPGATGSLGWTARVGTGSVREIAVGPDGTVYTGTFETQSSTISAVAPDGTVLWQKTVAGTVSGLLVTQGGQLLVAASKLSSIDASGGGQNWTFPNDFGVTFATNEYCFAPNVLSDGTIVQATSAKTYAIDPVARSVRWTTGAFVSRGGATLTADGTVVIWSAAEVRGLDGTTGAQRFSKAKTSDVGTIPSRGGTFSPIVRSQFGTTLCVYDDTLAVVESVFSGSASNTLVQLHYQTRYSGTATAYLQRITSGGTSTSPTLGSASVSRSLAPYTGLALPNGLAQRSSTDLLLSYVDATKRLSSWSIAAAGSAGASIAPDGTGYLVTNTGGLVKAFDVSSGSIRWTTTLPAMGSGYRPAIGPDGTVYAGTNEGRLVQVR